MSGENSQGWITEEAFFTVSGGRQVRQRKEVKMNHLSPAEKREFLKSMEVEWQTLLKNQAGKVLSLWKKRPKLERAGQIVLWTPAGPVLGSQTTASHRGAVRRHDSSLRVLQNLTSLTSSHCFMTLTREGFNDCKDNTSKDPFSRCEKSKNLGCRLSGQTQRQEHH